jgi:hypothetical protein
MTSNSELVRRHADDAPAFERHELSGLAPGLSVELGTASPEAWAGIIQNFGDANLYQTWPYSAARWGRSRLGHVVLKRGNQILAAAQVIFLKIPVSPRGWLTSNGGRFGASEGLRRIPTCFKLC